MRTDLAQARATPEAATGRTAKLLHSIPDGDLPVKRSDWTVEVGAHLLFGLYGFTQAVEGSFDIVSPYIPDTRESTPPLGRPGGSHARGLRPDQPVGTHRSRSAAGLGPQAMARLEVQEPLLQPVSHSVAIGLFGPDGLDGVVARRGHLEVWACQGVSGDVQAVMAVVSWSRVWMLSLR